MEKEKCDICNKSFGILRWRHKCSKCGATTCNSCCYKPKGLSGILEKTICSNCHNVIVAKSRHVAGYDTISEISSISSGWFEDSHDAIEYLKYICCQKEGNAILGLHIKKSKDSRTSDSKKGVYYFSIFNAHGLAVKVRKKQDDRKKLSKSSSVADDLQKLTKLRQLDAITEEEYREAKKKILE